MNPGPPITTSPLTKTHARGTVDHQYSDKGPLALYKDVAYACVGHAPLLIPRNHQARTFRPDIQPEYPYLGGYMRFYLSWVT
jgi:hypothetical protein